MRDQIISVLGDSNTRLLLQRVEEFSGVQIDFRKTDPSTLDVDIGDAPAGVEMARDNAIIHIFTQEPDFAGVTHELLHLERYWCDLVPALHWTNRITAGHEQVTTIENTLEHLVIVPKQSEYDCEDPEKWNQSEMEFWAGYPWPDRTPQNRLLNILTGWLTCMELVNDEEVKRTAENCLRDANRLVFANSLHKNILSSLGEKSQVALLFIAALNMPSNAFQMRTYDIKNSSIIDNPLPSF